MRENEAKLSGKKSAGWRPIVAVTGTVLALLVAVVVAGFVVAPKWATSLALRGTLAILGVPDARFTVEDASWRKLALADVSVGEVVSARRLAAEFGRWGPLGGVRGLDADGLRLSGTLDKGGFSFGALDPFIASGGGGAVALPSIALTDALLTLDTPYAQMSAQADATRLDPAQGGALRAAFSIAPRAGAPVIVAPHAGEITLARAADGAIEARLSFAAPVPAPQASTAVGETGMGEGPLNLVFNSAAFVLEKSITDEGWTGRVAIDAALDGALGQSLHFDDGALVLGGRFVLKNGKVTVFADHCAAARNVRFAMRSFSATSAALSLCQQAPERALFTREDGALAIDARVPPARISLRNAQGDLVTGALPALTIGITRKPTEWRAALKAEGGTLIAPTAALSVTALDLSGELAGKGDTLKEGTLKLVHAETADITRAPRFAPLTLRGKVDLARRRLVFALDAEMENTSAAALPVAHLEGEHDLDSTEGTAALTLQKLTFAEDALQPERLLPLLRGTITRASGTVGGKAGFSWGAAGFGSKADLELEDLGFHVGFAALQGVNGKVALSSLFPLETAAPQEIRVQTMDVGLPLREGVLRFEFAKGIDIRVREASFPFLTGRVFLEPFELGRGKEKKIALAFDRVDVKALLELVDIKGLTGTGRLKARIPVIFEGDRQIVQDGRAEAKPPGGSLTYKNVNAALESEGTETEILFKALDDFRYSALSVDLSGPLDGTLSLKVHLRGNNPALYNGYPVELNVSTEGPFVSMLRNGLYAYRGYDSQ